MKLQLMIILVISLANSQWSGDGSGGWNDDDDEGSGGGGDDDDDDFSGDGDDDAFSGDEAPLGEDEGLNGQEKFDGRGGYSDSYEEDAYIEEEYEAVLNSYSEEMYDDDTTGDSVEVFKEAVHNRTNSEEVPVYDYSDISDSKEISRENPKSILDVTTRKVADKMDSKEVSKETTSRKQHPTSRINHVTIRKLADVNSGQSSRIKCLLLILALTVHWMLTRFRIQPRRRGPRRVIQIRRPAHLH